MHLRSTHGPVLDEEEQKENKNESGTIPRLVHRDAHRRMRHMVRLARESLAFASVASFVWMICSVAAHVG
jgi:hypothetical protein